MQKIGEIPVNIGPRHFSIVQTEESSHEIVKCAQAGDRIRWHISSNTFDDSVKSQLVCDNPQTLQASFKLQLFSFVSFDCLGIC